jgi:hypothetical protein
METTLAIVGGTYREFCREPQWNELYGSGLRAAAALSGHVSTIEFTTCVGADAAADLAIICDTYGVKRTTTPIPETVSFYYHHPLSKPVIYPNIFNQPKVQMQAVTAPNILLFGLIEAEVQVHGQKVVYDPQSGSPIPFHKNGSTADQLALVLNRQEALRLSDLPTDTSLADVGRFLLEQEQADIVIIKNGAHGALVVELGGTASVPAFKTSSVWSIGSGDIFSAAFAWQWIVMGKPAAAAALAASKYTAHFCQNIYLPLPAETPSFDELLPSDTPRSVYLAGPFFTIAERWLIEECKEKLVEFGNRVFSPYHDIGIGDPHQVVPKDIVEIKKTDLLFAIMNGLDPGTLFEIGYAKALGKRVVVLAENIGINDLTMLIGTDCEITADFATAIYKASW